MSCLGFLSLLPFYDLTVTSVQVSGMLGFRGPQRLWEAVRRPGFELSQEGACWAGISM